MSAVLGIARREVHERRFLLGAAAVLSLVAGILRVVPSPWAKDLGESLTLLLLLAFPAGAALAVGSSLIGRDLAERRLSFYFSRPLSAGSLWAGKFLGGAVLVSGAFLCCYVPMVVGWLRDGLSVEPRAAGFMLLVFLALMGLAHVAITMYRSGSPLFALDLGLAAAFALMLAVEVKHLTAAGAGYALFHVLGPAALPALAIVTVVAAAAQLLYGGADPRRGHLALSVSVWSLAFVALGALALWGRWVLAVTPTEVGGVGFPVLAAPQGSAVFFKGPPPQGRAGFSPIFLMDGQSGAYLRVPPERMTIPAFSADGRWAAWVAPSVSWTSYAAPREVVPFVGSRSGLDLAVARLDGRRSAIEQRRLDDLDPASIALALDADARQVLVSGRSSVALVDGASGRVLARLALPDAMAGDFLPGGVVRLYLKEVNSSGGVAFVVLDWTPREGGRVERARWSGLSKVLWLGARRGDLSVVTSGSRGRALVDAGRGVAVTLETGPANVALVLSNGQVALDAGNEVHVVTRDGQTVARIPVEPRLRVAALRETAPGELAVGLWTPSLNDRRTVFADAATGAIRREEHDLLPAGPGLGTLPEPEPGSPASRLFVDPGGALIALGPDGEKRTLVPRGP
jgi:hypothetical protein